MFDYTRFLISTIQNAKTYLSTIHTSCKLVQYKMHNICTLHAVCNLCQTQCGYILYYIQFITSFNTKSHIFWCLLQLVNLYKTNGKDMLIHVLNIFCYRVRNTIQNPFILNTSACKGGSVV